MTSHETSQGIDLRHGETRDSSGEDDLPLEAARDVPERFSEVYEKHYTAIGNYIYRRTLNEHVTEDLVADVFLAVLRRLHRFQRRGRARRNLRKMLSDTHER